MKLIVGLGNPESKYAGTRHNLGFDVLNKYASSIRYPVLWEEQKKFKSQIAKITKDILCVKPQTYVNNSGLAVILLTTYYKIHTTDLIVIHDELDLPLGKIKVRLGGAAAGHLGVESIIEALGTDQFIRVRVGIGPSTGSGLALLGEHKKAHFSAEKFVLGPFLHSEKPKVKHMIKQALKALEILLEKGLEQAQNQFN